MTTQTPPTPPTVNGEAPEEQVTLSVKLPAGIHARMEQKAFNDGHVEKMAGHWLAQAAIDRFNRDEEFARDDSGDPFPARHLNSDEFWESLHLAFEVWREVKNALALVLASFTNGRKRRLKEADRLACHCTFKEMMDALKLVLPSKKRGDLLQRCHEANRQWLCIEAGHSPRGLEVDLDEFKALCDKLWSDLDALV